MKDITTLKECTDCLYTNLEWLNNNLSKDLIIPLGVRMLLSPVCLNIIDN